MNMKFNVGLVCASASAHYNVFSEGVGMCNTDHRMMKICKTHFMLHPYLFYIPINFFLQTDLYPLLTLLQTIPKHTVSP